MKRITIANKLTIMTGSLYLLVACGQQQTCGENNATYKSACKSANQNALAQTVSEDDADTISLQLEAGFMAVDIQDESNESVTALTSAEDEMADANQLPPNDYLDLESTCRQVEDSSIEDISLQFLRSKEVSVNGISSVIRDSGEAQMTQNWQKEGSSIGCGPRGRFVRLPLLSMAGVKLHRSYERQLKREGDHLDQARTYSDTGSLDVLWQKVSLVDSTIQVEKEAKILSVNYEFANSRVHGDGKGVMRSLDSAPLQIMVERAESFPWRKIAKTIRSGTLVAEDEIKGKRMTIAYDHLRIAKACRPSSGSIDVLIETLDGSAEGQHFTIEFKSASTYVITSADGSFVERQQINCMQE